MDIPLSLVLDEHPRRLVDMHVTSLDPPGERMRERSAKVAEASEQHGPCPVRGVDGLDGAGRRHPGHETRHSQRPVTHVGAQDLTAWSVTADPFLAGRAAA